MDDKAASNLFISLLLSAIVLSLLVVNDSNSFFFSSNFSFFSSNSFPFFVNSACIFFDFSVSVFMASVNFLISPFFFVNFSLVFSRSSFASFTFPRDTSNSFLAFFVALLSFFFSIRIFSLLAIRSKCFSICWIVNILLNVAFFPKNLANKYLLSLCKISDTWSLTRFIYSVLFFSFLAFNISIHSSCLSLVKMSLSLELIAMLDINEKKWSVYDTSSFINERYRCILAPLENLPVSVLILLFSPFITSSNP